MTRVVDPVDQRALSLFQLVADPSRESAQRLFERLAAADPVHWDPYTQSWLIAERSAAVQVLRDGSFSSRPERLLHPNLPEADRGALADLLGRQLMFLDGPAHARLRPVISRVLSPRRVRASAGCIAAATERACRRARDGETFDLVADIAVPVPLAVISQLLGLPEIDPERLLTMSDAYVRVITGIERTASEPVSAAVAQFRQFALEVVRHKRRYPADDGAGELVRQADALGGLDDEDIAANLVMLIAAGHQTTSGLIAVAMLDHLTHRSAEPKADQGEFALETELARISPSRFIARTATADRTIGSRTISAGQSVLVLLGAVGHTEYQRSRSDHPPRHIAFGEGAHRCPGAQLARLEAQIVCDQLRDLPLTRTTSDTRWGTNITLPGPTALPVTCAVPPERPHP